MYGFTNFKTHPRGVLAVILLPACDKQDIFIFYTNGFNCQWLLQPLHRTPISWDVVKFVAARECLWEFSCNVS